MTEVRGAEPPPPAPPANTARPLHAARPALPKVTRPEDAAGFGAVLRRRDFRLLWAAQVASQLADKFLMFSLLLIVYALSGHATAESALMLCYTLPSVVLSAPAGVFADRHDKRMLMFGCNVLRGGLILLIPLAQLVPGLKNSSWPLLLVTLLFSSAGQVFAPAEAASIPVLVGRNQISAATSLFMTTVIMTLVLGVPTATLSIRLFGDFAPFYIAAALFGVAGLCVWWIGVPLQQRVAAIGTRRLQEDLHGVGASVTRELREGLAILGRSPVLRIALVQLAVSLVVVFTVFALGPAYLTTKLHRSADDTYLVLIPATLGMVGVAAILGQAARRVSRARLLSMALVTAGGVLVALGVLPDVLGRVGVSTILVPITVVLSAVFGCALGSLLIPAFTVLQENTTEETRGRIFGGIFTVINAAVALPILLAGGIADLVGVDWVIGALGVLLVLGGVAALTRLHGALAVLDAPPLDSPAGVPGG